MHHPGLPANLRQLVARLLSRLEGHGHLRAVALVGSWARNQAGAGSDIDLLLLSSEPHSLLQDRTWTELGRIVLGPALEEWGRVRSLRLVYEDWGEVEFSIGHADWAALPPDPGTLRVVRDGLLPLHDPQGLLKALLEGITLQE